MVEIKTGKMQIESQFLDSDRLGTLVIIAGLFYLRTHNQHTRVQPLVNVLYSYEGLRQKSVPLI